MRVACRSGLARCCWGWGVAEAVWSSCCAGLLDQGADRLDRTDNHASFQLQYHISSVPHIQGLGLLYKLIQNRFAAYWRTGLRGKTSSLRRIEDSKANQLVALIP